MTDTEKAEYESVVGILTTKLEEAVGEINRLQALVAKLTGTDDAHSTLRRLYLDETQPSNVRVRAAQAAIGHESAPLKATEAPIDVVREPDLPLAEVIRLQRARADQMLLTDPQYRDLPKVFRSRPNGDGNGSDDSSSND